MGLAALGARAIEIAPPPDPVMRLGIGYLVARTRRRLAETPAMTDAAFAADMSTRPIAQSTDEANAQHYELPADFFRLVLGPHLKYSSCLYAREDLGLQDAEERALAETCAHAGLENGQTVLELGCGWGSLSLWMARRYPDSTITAVSNSCSQRETIEASARARGILNLRVITCDMNDFRSTAKYDRIVSVEMFEHIANWRALLTRLRAMLEPEGRLFLHVFSHREQPYWFDSTDPDDFIARHFFTGGMMPSHSLIRQFSDIFDVEEEWRWSGDHYRRTAMDWLANFDRNGAAVDQVLADVYGAAAGVWRRRWRVFFLAVAGLFGDSGGDVWGVSHYRLRPTQG